MQEKFIGIKGARRERRGIKVNHQTQHNKAIMQVWTSMFHVYGFKSLF